MPETRRVFHEELDELRQDVVRLGELAAEAIKAGTAALLDADLAAVERVVAGDQVLDDCTHSIEQRTCLLLARQQPMAVDLRTLVTILRVIHEIERVGDLMVRVAKATRRLYPQSLETRVAALIARMRDQALAQLKLALAAFSERDPAKAAALEDMDDVMDDLQRELFRTIFALGRADEAGLQQMVQVALVGRYYERMADHAVNIGERVTYMVTGEMPGMEGSDGGTGVGGSLGIQLD